MDVEFGMMKLQKWTVVVVTHNIVNVLNAAELHTYKCFKMVNVTYILLAKVGISLS